MGTDSSEDDDCVDPNSSEDLHENITRLSRLSLLQESSHEMEEPNEGHSSTGETKSTKKRLRPRQRKSSKKIQRELLLSREGNSRTDSTDAEWTEEMVYPVPDTGRFSFDDPFLQSQVHGTERLSGRKKACVRPDSVQLNRTSKRRKPAKGQARKGKGNGNSRYDPSFSEKAQLSSTNEQVYPGQPAYAPHIFNSVPAPDPNPFYLEENAWKYHNPPLGGAVSREQLGQLPGARPLPQFPDTGQCQWSFDSDSRVLLATFHGPEISKQDESFLLHIMERDDITTVSAGLIQGLDENKWKISNVANPFLKDDYYHKCRQFTKVTSVNGEISYEEMDGMLSMTIADYLTYLKLRENGLQDSYTDPHFYFRNSDGKDCHVDVVNTIIYVIDFDMVKLLPNWHDNFMSKCKLQSILPGGDHCMTSLISGDGRPFMGPNLHVTPTGSFTQFHQVGHGTVDSSHFCVSGFNEVVMIRRLTERHKLHAADLLRGDRDREGSYSSFGALDNLFHAGTLDDKPTTRWPSNAAIDVCREMGYCPSVFILKPGQLLHINKGRIHAFRKLSLETLPPKDCHAKLRRQLLDDQGDIEPLCISVVWDWMFRGVSRSGINREVVAMLECAELNRRHLRQSFALPELCLLQMARFLVTSLSGESPGEESCSNWITKAAGGYPSKSFIAGGFMPKTLDMLHGIFPGLYYVRNQHRRVMKWTEAYLQEQQQDVPGDRIRVRIKPQCWEDPSEFPLDPYGEGDFFCKICFKELANLYYHCDGCEQLLSKDFNICLSCHSEKRYKARITMHTEADQLVSTVHHMGDFRGDTKRCCKETIGRKCESCGYCTCCSCKCHTNFTVSFRFFTQEDEEDLFARVQDEVRTKDMLALCKSMECRLRCAATGGFDHLEHRFSG